MSSVRKVTIDITGKVVGSYEARSYPHDSRSDPNLIELYGVPLYEILVNGHDDAGMAQSLTFSAPRFMPYWNDPSAPSTHYTTRGWANAGLSKARTIIVTRYLPNYRVQNRYSPGRGAIVLKGSFYIHAGPGEVSDYGFGSAGCVEIVGDYDVFKGSIAALSGSALAVSSADRAIEDLIKHRKLVVEVRTASVPDLKAAYTRKVARSVLFPSPSP